MNKRMNGFLKELMNRLVNERRSILENQLHVEKVLALEVDFCVLP